MDNSHYNDEVYTANPGHSRARNFLDGSTKADTEKMSGSIGAGTGPGTSGVMTAEGARTLVGDPEHKLVSTATAMAYTPLEPAMGGDMPMRELRNLSFGTRRHSGADGQIHYMDQFAMSTVTDESNQKQKIRLPDNILREKAGQLTLEDILKHGKTAKKLRHQPLEEAPIYDDVVVPADIEKTEKAFYENATKQHNTSVSIGKRKNITFSKIGKIANVQVRSLAQQ